MTSTAKGGRGSFKTITMARAKQASFGKIAVKKKLARTRTKSLEMKFI